MRTSVLLAASVVAVLTSSCNSCRPPGYVCRAGSTSPTCKALAASPSIAWRLVKVLPHDESSFTEGLVFVSDRLFESSGRRSRLIELDPATGEVIADHAWPTGAGLPAFAEGLASDGTRLVQLSWQTGAAWTWDVATLTRSERLMYRGEGWGLCFDGSQYLRSDGTAQLTGHDPRTFAPTGTTIHVTLDGEPLVDLNELECVDGAVLANVWNTPYVVLIDPASGRVNGRVDLTELVARESARGSESVLNGVARDPATGYLHVTGKHWSHLYVIELIPSPDAGARL